MTSYQAIFEELKQLRNHLYGDFLIAEKNRIVELYRLILHKQVKNLACADCYRDAYIELYTYVQRHQDRVIESNPFVLKEGEIVHFFGEAEYYSHVIPEKVARRFLSMFPNGISKFAEYPDDWQSLENTDEQEADNNVDDEEEAAEGEPTESESAPVKRGRGRPRKIK